jgi:hypothetical protein
LGTTQENSCLVQQITCFSQAFTNQDAFMRAPPPVLAKPKLAEWMFARGIKPAAAAAALGCSKQTILNICQPFGTQSRTVPHEALLERIVDYTAGEITAADFYPPHLRGRQHELGASA